MTGSVDFRECSVCGCHDLNPCIPPCWWVDADLCSVCAAGDEDQSLHPELDRMLNLASFLCAPTSRLHMVTIPGPPVSKSRPRFTRSGHAYSTKGQRDAEEVRQRIDTDNLLKHVCDAANGILWEDDSQVTAVYGAMELDPDEPRTVVIVGEHSSSLTRGSDATRPCANCGAPMDVVKIRDSRKTCSPRCKAELAGISLADPVSCPTCAEPFRRQTASQTYCSVPCVPRKGRPRTKTAPERTCQDCNGPVSRGGRERCRECWKVARAEGRA